MNNVNINLQRPRRLRTTARLRSALVRRALRPEHLVLPVFIQDGEDIADPIASLPGCSRLSLDRAVVVAEQAEAAGILGLALFPVIADEKKTSTGEFATDPANILLRALPRLRQQRRIFC